MKRMLASALALAATTLGGAFTLVQPAHASVYVPGHPAPAAWHDRVPQRGHPDAPRPRFAAADAHRPSR